MEEHNHFQTNNSNKRSSFNNPKNNFKQITKEAYKKNETKQNKEKKMYYYNEKTKEDNKTMENWIKLTENKDLFKNLGEDTDKRNSKGLNMKPLNSIFYKNYQNDENENNIFKNYSSNNNHIDTSRNTCSINFNHENIIDGNMDNKNSNDHRSDGNYRNSSEINNTNTTNNSGNNNENNTYGNNNELKEERTIHTWIMKTENPELYKSTNDLEEDAKYREVTKYVDLENADNDIVDKLLSQNVLMNKYEEMKNKRRKKRAYCLFYNGSDCDEFATPSKKCGSLFSQSYGDKTYGNNLENDTHQISSMFEIKKNETNYLDHFSKASVEKRESYEANKNMDPFPFNVLVTSNNEKKNQYDENFQMTKNEIHSFLNNPIEYETPVKFLKKKIDSNDRNSFENQIELINRTKNKNKENEEENKEENKEHLLYKKNNPKTELDRSSSVNTTKEASSMDSDSLNYSETKELRNNIHKIEEYNYFQTNSDTEITTSPEVIENRNITSDKNHRKTLFKSNLNRNVSQWNFF